MHPSPRLCGSLVILAVIGSLVIAAGLQPDPAGLGTHRQLGLPPCSTRVLFGVRCPMCGMTTSWAYFVRGNLFSAASVNLGGLLLAVYATVWLEIARRMIRDNRWPKPATVRGVTVALLAILAVTLADWWSRLG